jgi:hypothetical protein
MCISPVVLSYYLRKIALKKEIITHKVTHICESHEALNAKECCKNIQHCSHLHCHHHHHHHHYYYYYYYIMSFMQGFHTYIPETNHVSRA